VPTRISVPARDRIETLPAYRPYLDGVLTECAVPLTWSATWIADFASWFVDQLAANGIAPPFEKNLAEAAADQLRMTAVMRFIGTTAWRAAEPEVPKFDAAFLGSIGRCEAGSSSDFDLLFAGADEAALTANGVAITDPQARRGVLMRGRPWCTTFRDACVAEQYQFPEWPDKPDLRVIAMTEFTSRTSVLTDDEKTANAANYTAAGYELRTSEPFKALRAYAAKQGAAVHGAHRLKLMRHYLDNEEDDGRAHSAHGFLSQAWQAILFYVKRPMYPRTPYWKVPLIVPLDTRGGQQAWTDAMRELYLKRRSNAVAVDGFIPDAVIYLARAAVRIGLDPRLAREILAAADPSAVL
jgi:hypothetical protein